VVIFIITVKALIPCGFAVETEQAGIVVLRNATGQTTTRPPMKISTIRPKANEFSCLSEGGTAAETSGTGVALGERQE
jgi:hypothetical protein